MSDKIGVWIDHRHAILVRLHNGEDRLTEIESKVGKHVRESGGARGSTPYATEHNSAGDQYDRNFHHQLDEYYDRVIEALGDFESVWIIGPGEAKGEFEKRIIRHKPLRDRISGTAAADKLTNPQLVAKVREYFQT
jgi:hypothetical protein